MPSDLNYVLESLIKAVDRVTARASDLELIEFPPRIEGVGNGIAGRVAKWSDTKTITAAALIPPASNVLTLAAGGAYTLTVNQNLTLAGVTGKTLTINENLTLAGVTGKTLTINENLTLAGVSGKTLTVNENITLAGATGKVLTLTTNLTNQGNNGVLNWSGAYTLTIGATGTATLGAGTLSASSVNDAGIADHTHAITASASPGAAASLLKTTAAGLLTLAALTVTTLTVGTNTLAMSANLTLAGVNGKTLTVNENLTLAGATGRVLTLTTNLTNQGAAGVLAWGGAYTLTIPATGTAALGADTLTVSSTNDVTGSAHTHAITANSNPGSVSAILKTNADGLLILRDLTVNYTLTAGQIVVDTMTIDGGELSNDSSGAPGIVLTGDGGTEVTTKATSSTGQVVLKAQTDAGNCGSNANLAVIRNNATTRFIFDAEGSAHADSECTPYDEYDDVALVASLEHHISKDPIKDEFQQWVTYNRKALEKAKLITFNPDGRHFLNTTRLSMLLVGAVQQLASRLDRMEKN